MAEESTRPPTALGNITVLDFTRVLAGPYCTMALGDLGAEIIKVENPAGGDDSRRFMPPDVNGEAVYFMHVNRNKQSVALDLRKPEGRAAALRLAAKADVVIENYRPGVMDRLGLSYKTLSDQNPGLVFCSISGYGSDGPLSSRAGLDPVIQAESGLMSLTGEAGGGPIRTGVSLVDAMTGVFASQSILAALLARGQTGRGQQVEVCLFDTGINMLVNFGAGYLMTGTVAPRIGNSNQVSQPAGSYQAADGLFLMTAVGDHVFERLCKTILDEPKLLEDPRFTSNPKRLENVEVLTELLDERFKKDTRTNWITKMREAGIPAGEIRELDEALQSEEFKLRDLVRTVEHPIAGRLPVIRSPMRLSDTPVREPEAAPLLGQHTESVLRRVAEYGDAEIETLRESEAALFV